jgi:hypothetical protein
VDPRSRNVGDFSATNGGVAEGAAAWGRNGGAGGAGWRLVASRLVGSERGRGSQR